MSKKEKFVNFNRASILKSAEMLFAEKGLDNTTMDEISKHASCSKSTIYVYFKSKEEIFNNITYINMGKMELSVQKCLDQNASFEETFFNLCNQLTNLHQENPMFFSSMMGRIGINPDDLLKDTILQSIFEIGERINDLMLKLFQQGMMEDHLEHEVAILPTVFTLWASIANIIAIASTKSEYIHARMQMNQSEFLDHSFKLLLKSIKKEKR